MVNADHTSVGVFRKTLYLTFALNICFCTAEPSIFCDLHIDLINQSHNLGRVIQTRY